MALAKRQKAEQTMPLLPGYLMMPTGPNYEVSVTRNRPRRGYRSPVSDTNSSVNRMASASSVASGCTSMVVTPASL